MRPNTSKSHDASTPAFQTLWSGNTPDAPGKLTLDKRCRAYPADTVVAGVSSSALRTRSERAALTRARAARTSRLARCTSPMRRDSVVSPSWSQYSVETALVLRSPSPSGRGGQGVRTLGSGGQGVTTLAPIGRGGRGLRILGHFPERRRGLHRR